MFSVPALACEGPGRVWDRLAGREAAWTFTSDHWRRTPAGNSPEITESVMSRHLFDATLEDQRIRITVGHDRPTATFYLHIGWVDAQTGKVVAYASDLNLAYDPKDWRTIRRFLERLHVVTPASVWTELAYDCTLRSGNRVVKHLGNGTMNELIAW
jgi:hypothetical protein